MPGIAIVGASERNFWFSNAMYNILECGYKGQIWPVNPNYESVGGRPCVPALTDIDGELDAVIVAVAASRCPEIVRQAVLQGCQDIVVVSNGFAEMDSDDGARLQKELLAACGPQTRLYGPNCVGFADFRRRLCAIAEPVPVGVEVGPVSIVSQSGAVLSTMMAALIEDGLGLDWCASLGNAANFDLAHAVDYACERGTTRVLCVYAETLGADPRRLQEALERARRNGVTVAVLKVGRSSQSARIALSHTASVAGDDALVDAFLRGHGVIRVDSFEELARVATVAALLDGRPASGGTLVIGQSGGSAAVSSELSSRESLALAALTDETMDHVRASAGPGSFIENPMDLVGRPGAGAEVVDELYTKVFADENVSIVLSPWTVIFPDDSPQRATHRVSLNRVSTTARRAGTPTLISSLAIVPWTDYMLEFRRQNPHLAVVRGLETTIRALSHFFAAELEPAPSSAAPAAAVQEDPDGDHVVGEILGRARLAELGLPLAAGNACRDADEAADAFHKLRAPVVVKLDISSVSHKAKLGAVTLGCRTETEVRTAVAESLQRVAEAGIAADAVLGILVEEMVSGTEVLVGLSRSELGAFLTIGAGGTAAGPGTSARTLLLPTSRTEVASAVSTAIGPTEPDQPGTMEAIQTVERLCHAFQTGSLRECSTVEINPLFVSPGAARIADVLIVEGRSNEDPRSVAVGRREDRDA